MSNFKMDEGQANHLPKANTTNHLPRRNVQPAGGTIRYACVKVLRRNGNIVASAFDKREFKKTTTITSCRTPPNNGVNEQNNEPVRAKYNLVDFSAVLYKTKT